ncbi:MAG: amidohydrolase [Candidatus Brocadiales bacterium]
MSNSGIVLLNARILTMDRDFPLAEAVVTPDDRITYVGDRKGLGEGLIYGKELIDLGGRTVVPGFIDSHVHLVEMAKSRLGLDLGGCRSIKEALDIVEQGLERRPRGEWVIGYNWDESRWKEGRIVTIEELDRVSPHHPVILKRICQHLVLVNSRALELARIPKGTEGLCTDPKTGNPNGIIQQDARRIVESHLKFSPQKLYAAIETTQKEMLALGITSIHDMGSDFRLLQRVSNEGRLVIRTHLYVEEHALSDIDGVGGALRDEDNCHFRIGGVKFFLDGSIGAHSAALSEPYADGRGGCGRLRWDKDALKSLVSKLHEKGWQVSLHAIGDRAVTMALEVLEHAQNGCPRKASRHRIEHCELLPEGALEQIKNLGVIVSAQPNFSSMWGRPGGMYEKLLGKRRWEGVDPWGIFHSRSIPLAFGSDGMPVGPLYGIWSAANHPVEESRLGPLDALRSYTHGSAFASFEEDVKGTIAQGKLADMVVLSRDPTAIPRKEIKDIKVEMTILGGKVLHDNLSQRVSSY